MTRQHLLPLLQIEPGTTDEEYGRPVGRKAIDKAMGRLRVLGGQELLLDVGLLDAEVALEDGSRSDRLRPVPGAGPWHAGDARAAARGRTSGPRGCASCARTPADRHRDPAERRRHGPRARGSWRWRAELSSQRPGAGSPRTSISCSTSAASSATSPSGRSRGWPRTCCVTGPAADEWRHVIVAAGAFPADLGEIVAWEIGELPRWDAALFDRLQGRRRLPSELVFGDYAVTNPVATSAAYRSAPNLRYAVADRWLFLKGADSTTRVVTTSSMRYASGSPSTRISSARP